MELMISSVSGKSCEKCLPRVEEIMLPDGRMVNVYRHSFKNCDCAKCPDCYYEDNILKLCKIHQEIEDECKELGCGEKK